MKNISVIKLTIDGIPLLHNSTFILISQICSAIIGFSFWVITAKFFSSEDVGLAVAITSSISFLTLLSKFGFEQSIIRFILDYNEEKIFGTSLICVLLFSIVFGILYYIVITFGIQNLQIIQEIPFYFIVFLLFNSIMALTGVLFLAWKKPQYYCFQNLILGLNILFIPFFVHLGALGIFFSFEIPIFISCCFSLMFLRKLGIRILVFDFYYLKYSFEYSFKNYLAGLFAIIPGTVLPILVLNNLGAKETANFFMAYAIASGLYMIPSSFGTGLFIEGSHGASLKENSVRTLKLILIFLIPAIAFLYFFGNSLLALIGKSYSGSSNLLIYLVGSSFFISIYQIFSSVKKIQKELNQLIVINLILFILLLSTSDIMMHIFGIDGIGFAWLISYGIISIIILILLKYSTIQS